MVSEGLLRAERKRDKRLAKLVSETCHIWECDFLVNVNRKHYQANTFIARGVAFVAARGQFNHIRV